MADVLSWYIDGLVQYCSNTIANAQVLLQSCEDRFIRIWNSIEISLWDGWLVKLFMFQVLHITTTGKIIRNKNFICQRLYIMLMSVSLQIKQIFHNFLWPDANSDRAEYLVLFMYD